MTYTYTLRFDDLLSKFGFWDGDIFEEEYLQYLKECKEKGEKHVPYMSQLALVKIVEDFILTKIPFKFEHTVVSTMHNPIRLISIEGQDDYQTLKGLLANESVKISSSLVKEYIKEIHHANNQ